MSQQLTKLSFGWFKATSGLGVSAKRHYYAENSKISACGKPLQHIPQCVFLQNPPEHRKCKNCILSLETFSVPSNQNRSPTQESKPYLELKITNHPKKQSSKHDTYKLVETTCSYPNCKQTGMTYIKTDEDVTTNSHFCTKHNPRIKEMQKHG